MSIQLDVNNRNQDIKPQEIPKPCAKTAAIFEEIVGPNTVPAALSTIHDRATRLEELIPKLENAQEHAKRNKILGILGTALSIALLAGGIIALTVGTAGVAAAVAGGLFVGHLGLSILYATLLSDKPINEAWPLYAPFLPIFHAFTRVGYMDKEVKELTSELPKELQTISAFYQSKEVFLKEKLQEEINSTRQSLGTLVQQPIRSKAGEKELNDRLEACEQALTDLEQGFNYFKNFI